MHNSFTQNSRTAFLACDDPHIEFARTGRKERLCPLPIAGFLT